MTALLERTGSITADIFESKFDNSSSVFIEDNYLNEINKSLNHEYINVFLNSFFDVDIKNIDSIHPVSLFKAVFWQIELSKIVKTEGLWWEEPLVNFIDSEIVFEWWNKTKKITVYISENSFGYIKVWGPDVDTEMQDGEVESIDDIRSLWVWISS